jgi:hypothetical protein
MSIRVGSTVSTPPFYHVAVDGRQRLGTICATKGESHLCTVSNIGDSWGKTYPYRYPWIQPWTAPDTSPPLPQVVPLTPIVIGVSQDEFDKLKNELEELKALLRAAKHFDKITGQPDCEVDEKVGLIKKIAELMGVDLEDVLG